MRASYFERYYMRAGSSRLEAARAGSRTWLEPARAASTLALASYPVSLASVWSSLEQGDP